MKISLNWLKEYIDTDLSAEQISDALTQTGLEVEGTEEFISVKGGLQGLVIGQVKTCHKHPDADKLSITTVDLGHQTVPIVCGAPNVAAGQKVVVATVGTELHPTNGEPFKIKKSKIRGEVSQGMICAEDEIGLGTSHDGIMVLHNNAPIGTAAADYFKIQKDTVFEIGLTPNRIDGASHIGVARDLAAFLNKSKPTTYNKPEISHFAIDNNSRKIDIQIENPEACKRYTGLTISNITVKESPDWLKNRLKAIGAKPINNVVDVTNYVLHEIGHPLHAFDADQITGNKVVVKTLNKDSSFVTLDLQERKLLSTDLMICNSTEGMCMAGVFGGEKSGVTEKTKNVFLESAYFSPTFVRKTAKHHGLSTDASFRFERGADPNITVWALKRAALLIKELAGGEISSEIVDVYPERIEPKTITLTYANMARLIGKEIEPELAKKILKSLEFEITNESPKELILSVPTYRVDVTREADVIEEILRIYGYNNVGISETVHSNLSYAPKPDKHKIKNKVADFLSARGFNEAMSNSLTKADYYTNLNDFSNKKTVRILNPLSSDLNAMRQTLIFGGLEAIERSLKHRTQGIKLYEFGNVYSYKETNSDEKLKAYNQFEQLALFITGFDTEENWTKQPATQNFYHLKTQVHSILEFLNFPINKIHVSELQTDTIAHGLSYQYPEKGAMKPCPMCTLVEFGYVEPKLLKQFGLKENVFYASFRWDNIMETLPKTKQFAGLEKYPAVRRDLALLVDKTIKFEDLKCLALQTEKKLLKTVDIFDVFEDEKLGANKKSYALSFILQDSSKTLTDRQIDKTMQRLQQAFEQTFKAELR